MGSVWEDVRRDFPALDSQAYLNAAAGSPLPRSVREAAESFYRDMEAGGDREWDTWLTRVEDTRRKVAAFVGADADEIAFVPNTSAGMNLVVDLLADEGAVLSDELEFPTVTLPWIHRGTSVVFMTAGEGVLRLESFQAAQAPRAATICISHVQVSNGCRSDLDAFAGIKAGRNFVVCGSQSAGAFPIDVRRSQIDAFVTAGHKWLCAGYGTGFAFVRREILEKKPPRAVGWMSGERPFDFDNRRLQLKKSFARSEMGCPPFASIFALGAAIDYLTGLGTAAIAERILALNMYLTSRLQRRDFEVLSPGGDHRSGETLVAVKDPKRAHFFLAERRVLVTEKPEGLRIATHFYNNERDVDACVENLIAYRAGA
ncbi:MAG TPA: aminotransferase class V-fold PLP-dependent enzyme [Vicinamibacteria bacterium]